MKEIVGRVIGVHRSANHSFNKFSEASVSLIEGLGIEGDAHMGTTVKHRSRVAQDPTQPNLRQVHLVPTEIHEHLSGLGYDVEPGEMGENITTQGADLNALPVGTVLALGPDARVELTGLRNPCPQLKSIDPGLMKELVFNDEHGNTVRLAGVMSVVVASGVVRSGDEIVAHLPALPHVAMDRV